MSPPAVYVIDVPIVSASVHPTVANVLQYSSCEFLLLLLSLMLLASLLHIAGFSTVADFPTNSGGSASVDIP
jgi:hypothetical protein